MKNQKSKIKNQKYNSKNLLSVICYLLSEKGQSILEVLIALTLIIIFLSGVVVMQLYAVKNISYSQNKSIASQFARQQLDRVRVVRDSAGMDALAVCQSSCFINSRLTPVQGVTPTGIFNQVVSLEAVPAEECPLPDVTIVPTPITYKVTTRVFLKNTDILITPTPMAVLQSCITDWR